MSTETRKQHRHDAPSSRIDPSMYWGGCIHVLAVESHLWRTATPMEGPICPENLGEQLEEKMVSSDTRRNVAINLRLYGVPGVIAG